MIYLSKGIVQRGSTEQRLAIFHLGQTFQLVMTEAALWLKGRFGFAVSSRPSQEHALMHLEKMGLVETEPEDNEMARYRILTRCICCPVKTAGIQLPVGRQEKELLNWLQHAGIRLSVAELVFLKEHRIKPEPKLLYGKNRQALVEAIYTEATIMDQLLEQQMESAACRDGVVRSLQRLLEKKRVLML